MFSNQQKESDMDVAKTGGVAREIFYQGFRCRYTDDFVECFKISIKTFDVSLA